MIPDTHVYYADLIKADSPSTAFSNLKSNLEIWESVDQKEWPFIPKHYKLLNAPGSSLKMIDAIEIIESQDYKVRSNYAGCLFLDSNTYLFFCWGEEFNYD